MKLILGISGGKLFPELIFTQSAGSLYHRAVVIQFFGFFGMIGINEYYLDLMACQVVGQWLPVVAGWFQS
jgi:hypothetical protein